MNSKMGAKIIESGNGAVGRIIFLCSCPSPFLLSHLLGVLDLGHFSIGY